MDEQDERFENYLREFQPLRPRPLWATYPTGTGYFRRLAAAAVIVIILGTSLFVLKRHRAPRQIESVRQDIAVESARKPVPSASSLLSMRRLALEDPARFDAALNDASQHLLPSFESSASTLRVLAKE